MEASEMVKSKSTVAERIGALREMKVSELIAEYEKAFGEPPRSKNHAFLWRRISWKIQADAEGGGLSERAKASLVAIAADVEEAITKRCRAVSAPARPDSNSSRSGKSEVVSLARIRREGLPLPGTRLSRQFHGQTITVTIQEDGVEYAGVLYRSLSAVANAVTGSHVSGHVFFGLRARKSAAKWRAKK